jgi:hypothetical protein
MRSNAGMANTGGRRHALRASVRPQLTLWLGLAWLGLAPGRSWKYPALPSSYGPISLLDTVGKLFEKILLNKFLYEVSERRLMRDEQFGFRPRHSTSLQLARLVLRLTRNFGEKSLRGAVFFDVSTAFDIVWIDSLLYKLTILNLPSYLVHTISAFLRFRTFAASF